MQVEAVCGTTINVADYTCFLQKEEQVQSLSEEVSEIAEKRRGVVKRKYPKEAATIIEIKGNAPAFVPFKKGKKKVKILFLSATPSHAGQINTGKGSRFKDLFIYFDNEKTFKWKEQHGVNPNEFFDFYIKEKPHILHYGGHGEVEGIVLEEGNLEGDILMDLFRITQKTQCVVLNACYSVSIAKKIAEYVPYVIGTQGPIDDRSAIAFSRGFYMGIVAGDTVEDSFEFGITKIKQKKLPDADIFILVKGINPSSPTVATSDIPKSAKKKKKKKKKNKIKNTPPPNETVVKIQISQDNKLSQQMTSIENKVDAISQTLEDLPSQLKDELVIVLEKAEEGKLATADMQQMITDIQKGMERYGENLPVEIVKIWKQANDKPADQLDVKGKFKLTIPLIPLFFKYEKELNLDLVKIGRNIWRKGIIF